MQFTNLALLSLSALAIAAPVETFEDANPLMARTGSTVCCPKGKKSGCTTLAPGQTPPANTDVYKDCANILNIGLVNLVLCNILNNVDVSVPITLSLLSS